MQLLASCPSSLPAPLSSNSRSAAFLLLLFNLFSYSSQKSKGAYSTTLGPAPHPPKNLPTPLQPICFLSKSTAQHSLPLGQHPSPGSCWDLQLACPVALHSNSKKLVPNPPIVCAWNSIINEIKNPQKGNPSSVGDKGVVVLRSKS